MNEQLKKQIFKKIQGCLASLAGGSGHMASYSVNEKTFKITRTIELPGSLTKYLFEADAYRESEFIIYDENYKPESEHIQGNITLDSKLRLVKDKTGRIMLEPWKCVDQTTERQW